MDVPKVVKSSSEYAEPSRAKERRDREEPSEMPVITDRAVSAPTAVTPTTDSAEARRTNDLMDREDPIGSRLTTDSEAPRREKLLSETVDPM
mmetsp:Transcript_28236/g.61361  ORF Transcript_28236/g.61361 Transcript_28236/m.61361 type:complete len:92 (+) Transcript_28236:1655-1930(+)